MNIGLSTLWNKRFAGLGVSVLLAALLLVASGGPGASSASWLEPMTPDPAASTIGSSQVITIGVAAALSGGVEAIGWPEANAVQLAVDQINAGGGVDVGGTSYTLALVSADSACNPAQAVVAANALLDEGAVAVVGDTCTIASNAAQSVYAAAGVSMISPSSTGPQLTEQGYTTTFRVISRDDAPAARLATYLRTGLAVERAAIVEMQGFWGNWVGDVFSDTFTSLGGTITSRHTVISTDNFTATLSAIKDEDPDTIHFAHDDGTKAGLLSRVAYNLGMNDVPIAWTTYTENRDVLGAYANTAGIAAEGDIAAMYYRAPEMMPGYPALNADYVAAGFTHYGDAAQMCGAFAFDAAQIIAGAIDRADSTDPADIRDEIAATSHHSGVVGTYIGFDQKGDVIPQWTWMEQYREGQWVLIWPHRLFLPITLQDYEP